MERLLPFSMNFLQLRYEIDKEDHRIHQFVVLDLSLALAIFSSNTKIEQKVNVAHVI